MTDGFVEAMVASPLGVTLLAALESSNRRPAEWGLSSVKSSYASVDAAVEAVESMSFGDFVDLAVLTGVMYVGPWMSDAPANAAAAYRRAVARVPIAEAVSRRFSTQLHQPIGRDAQEWWADWSGADPWLERVAPLFRRFNDVYGAGQFTGAGLWTATDPPVEAHEQLKAQVFEIHRPADWARLVMEHPREASVEPGDACWELPTAEHHRPAQSAPRPGWAAHDFGRLEPNPSGFVFGVPEGFATTPPADVSALMAVPGQRAARTTFRRHLVPDWRSVAERYDGVHLSWAGFITSEGCVTDLDGGDVAMLRYWFSERTHWLADVFGEPQRACDPVRGDPGSGIPLPPSDAQRRQNEIVLHRLLSR